MIGELIANTRLGYELSLHAAKCIIALYIEDNLCHIEIKNHNFVFSKNKIIECKVYPLCMCLFIDHVIYFKFADQFVPHDDSTSININRKSYDISALESIRDKLNLFGRIQLKGYEFTIKLAPSVLYRSQVGFDVYLRKLTEEDAISHFFKYREICDLIIFDNQNVTQVISLRRDTFDHIEIIDRLDLRTY